MIYIFAFSYYILLIVIIGFLIGATLYLTASLISAFYKIPYVGTRKSNIVAILREANTKKAEAFIDLGSGDGRVVLTAARVFKLKAIGIELNPVLILLSKIIAIITHTHNATFKCSNALQANISKADYIYMFLLPQLLTPLSEKIKSEGKRGALVISHGFKIPRFSSKLEKELPGRPFTTYYYRI